MEPSRPNLLHSFGVALLSSRRSVRGHREIGTLHHAPNAFAQNVAVPPDQAAQEGAVTSMWACLVRQEGDCLILLRLRREGCLAVGFGGHEQVAVGLHQDCRDQGRFG